MTGKIGIGHLLRRCFSNKKTQRVVEWVVSSRYESHEWEFLSAYAYYSRV